MTRLALYVGVLITINLPGLEPFNRPLLYSIVGVQVLLNLVYLSLGPTHWSPRSFNYTGLLDAAGIGALVWLTGGSASVFIPFYSLLIMFGGVVYGWRGVAGAAVPSMISVTIASIASSEPLNAAWLTANAGVWIGLGFFAGVIGEKERRDRAELLARARGIRRQAKQIQALYETSTTIGSHLEAEALLTTAAERTSALATELWGDDVVISISLLDESKTAFEVARVVGPEPGALQGDRIPLSVFPQSVVERFFSGKPGVISGIEAAKIRSTLGIAEEADFAFAPIVAGGEVLGALVVRVHHVLPEPEQLDLLQTISNHIASALSRVRALEEERRRRKQATELFEFARDLQRVGTLDDALRRLAQAGLSLMGVDECGVGQLSNESSEPIRCWLAGPAAPDPEAFPHLLEGAGAPEVWQAIGEQRPVEIPGLQSASAEWRRVALVMRSRRWLLFPVSAQERAVAVLCFGHVDPSKPFSIAQWQMGEALSGLAAVALENIRLYEAEKRTVAKLQELDRLRSEMVSTASHELRSPLTSIAGYARTLLRPEASFSDEERREFLTVIDRQAKQLARLIDELLTASRVAEGRAALSLQGVDVSRLAMDAVAAAKMRTDRHFFLVEIPPELPAIVADEAKLSEIVTNLLDNAIKYSPEGGNITLGAKLIDNEARIWVSDDGIGIGESDLARIFDRFYQVEGRPEAGGQGLGLYIVSQLVKAHDGRVWAESETGRGTTISLALPQRRASDRLASVPQS